MTLVILVGSSSFSILTGVSQADDDGLIDICKDEQSAVEEYRSLIHTLDEVGLRTEVRHGNGSTLLVFVKAPRELVGNWIYMSRYATIPHVL